MIDSGAVLWSEKGKWRILDERGNESQQGNAPLTLLRHLAGNGTTVIAVSGSCFSYWDKLLPGVKHEIVNLPFVVIQAALTGGGKELVVIGEQGQWIRYFYRSGEFEEYAKGRIGNLTTCCAIEKSGSFWIIGTLKGEVFLCSKSEQRIIARHNTMVRAVAIHPEGSIIASGGQDGLLKLTSARGLDIYSVNCGSWINDLTFSVDGQEVFFATEAGQLHSIATDGSNEPPLLWTTEESPLKQVCVFPSKRVAVILANDHRTRLVERPRETAPAWRPPLSGNVKYVYDWENGQTILAIDSEDNSFFIELGSSRPRTERVFERSGSVMAAAMVDRHELLTAYQDLGKNRVTRRFPGLESSGEQVVLPRGRFGIPPSLLLKSPFSIYNMFQEGVFSPDQQTFALTRRWRSDDGSWLEAYDTRSWKRLFKKQWDYAGISKIAISDGARRFLVAQQLLQPPRLLLTDDPSSGVIDIPIEGCVGASFSSNGDELLVIDSHRTAWIRNNMSTPGNCERIRENIACGDISPDGLWILLCDADGQIMLFCRSFESFGLELVLKLRGVVPWTPNYCRIYAHRKWVILGGQGRIQVLRWSFSEKILALK
jgi:WD40 repeat protein